MSNTSHPFPLDFLIAGTMKSGTSTLSYVLDQHPHISLPDRELHFFDRNFDKGTEWYRDQLLKKGENFRLYGEKTPDYALKDAYADEIKKLNPEVKLVWLFRNPAKRAFSHYLHNVRSGRENKSFGEALRLEEERGETIFGYRAGSDYPAMIRRFADRFPIDQMFFATFESYVASPEPVVRNILQFLGVEPVPNFQYASHRHKTLMPKHTQLLHFTRNYIGYETRIWNRVYRFANHPSRLVPPPKMPADAYTQLRTEFDNQIKDLQKITGLDLSTWN